MKKLKLKISNPDDFEEIYELKKGLDDVHKKGRQYGKKGDFLHTPGVEDTPPYDAEAVEIAIKSGYFERIK